LHKAALAGTLKLSDFKQTLTVAGVPASAECSLNDAECSLNDAKCNLDDAECSLNVASMMLNVP
jgi:hypothetical protein